MTSEEDKRTRRPISTHASAPHYAVPSLVSQLVSQLVSWLVSWLVSQLVSQSISQLASYLITGSECPVSLKGSLRTIKLGHYTQQKYIYKTRTCTIILCQTYQISPNTDTAPTYRCTILVTIIPFVSYFSNGHYTPFIRLFFCDYDDDDDCNDAVGDKNRGGG